MRPTPFRIGLALLAAAIVGPPLARADVGFTGFGATIRSGNVSGEALDIPATVLKPDGAGPFPAVVILHDCSGLGAYSSGSPGRWGNLLAAAGYVAIIPDSFLPRGAPDGVCMASVTPQVRRDTGPRSRMIDAYATLAFLRTLAYVDGKRVGVMGGSHGGSSTLATMVDPGAATGPIAEAKRDGFAAGIALYPGCGAPLGAWNVQRQFGERGPVTSYVGLYKPVAPLLILIGEKDDWTPADQCQALAERAAAAGFPVSIKVYPGAYHSFDSANPVRYIAGRNNVNKPEGKGATTGGDPSAWANAVKEVSRFFADRLKRPP